MRIDALVLFVALASGGCDKTEPVAQRAKPAKTAPAKVDQPKPAGAGESAKVDETSAPKAVGDAAPDEAPAEEDAPSKAPPVGEASPSPWATDVGVVVAAPKSGRLRVAAAHEGSDSVLWAQSLTAKDTPAGPATKLRRTSGDVGAIAAAVSGELLWVAWRSDLGGDKKQITALAGFDLGLKIVHEPRILRTIEDRPESDANLMVVARGGDGRVAVAALVGTRSCKGLHPKEDEGSCRGMQIDLVAADGTSERSERRWLDGGDGGIDGLVDMGTGVVSSFHVWHGGPLTDVALIPADPASAVKSLETCDYPPIEPLVVGSSIITLCPDPDSSDGEGSSPDVGCKATEEGATCGHMARLDLTGARVAPSSPKSLTVPLTAVSKHCDGTKASVRLDWKGGGIDVDADSFGVRCP